MDDKCFHRLPTGNEKVAMGKAKVFPNPFYYEPSPLARLAVTLLQQSLPMLKEGKMFGVLIVEYGGKVRLSASLLRTIGRVLAPMVLCHLCSITCNPMAISRHTKPR